MVEFTVYTECGGGGADSQHVRATVTSGDDISLDWDDETGRATDIDVPYGSFAAIYPLVDRIIDEHVITVTVNEAPVCDVIVGVPHRHSGATVAIRAPAGSTTTCALFVRMAGGGQGCAITLGCASRELVEKASRFGHLCYWSWRMQIGPELAVRPGQ
jgi:hypothetical protein